MYSNRLVQSTLILLVLSLIFFNQLLLNPELSLLNGDLLVSNSIWKFLPFDEIQKGQPFPLWNPYLYSGTPYLGNLQTGMFYPLFWLFFFFPFESLLSLELFLHVFLAGFFMLLFLRKGLGLNYSSALIGAIAFMFSGKFMAHVWFGHMVFWPGYALLPLLFLLVKKGSEKQNLFYAIFAGIVLTINFFGTHTQLFYYSFAALTLFFVFEEFQNRKKFPHNLKFVIMFLVILVAVFTALSAAELLPAIELLGFTEKSAGLTLEQASIMAWQPENLISFLIPNLFGNPVNHTYWGRIYYVTFVLYVGIVTLCLSLLGLAFKRNKTTMFFFGLLLLSLAIAFGTNFVLFPLLYYVLPGISFFRIPSRAVFIAVFALSVLAGIGASTINAKIYEKNGKNLARFLRIFAVIVILAVITVSATFFLKDSIQEMGEKIMLSKYADHPPEKQAYYLSQIPAVYAGIFRDVLSLGVALTGFFLVLLLYWKKKINAQSAKAILAVLLFFDLFWYGTMFLELKDPKKEFEPTPSMKFIGQDKSRYRVWDINQFLWYHKSVRAGLETVNGYDPTNLSHYIEFVGLINQRTHLEVMPAGLTEMGLGDFINNSRYHLLDLLNVKYIVTSQELINTPFRKAFADENTIVYENPNVLPRAFVVGEVKSISSKEELIAKLSAPEFNPREYALISQPTLHSLDGNFFKEATITSYSPNKIMIDIELEQSGFLVLSEIWYPGWKAVDNGQETNIFRTNYSLRGIFLDQGHHQIEFSFEPQSFNIGLIISILTLIICLAVLAFGRLQKRF